MIFAYNKQNVGDTLMVLIADDHQMDNISERKGNVARISIPDGTTVAWNFFDISRLMIFKEDGQQFLSEKEIDLLNQELKNAGFEERLPDDNEPKFVVGYVKTSVDHPDSDHLHITETEIDNGQVLQIVCGAKNIAAGQKVVVAKPGAMMPDGMMIWPGKLRGVESFGMICSAAELHLPDAKIGQGILVLPEDTPTGEAFPIGK